LLVAVGHFVLSIAALATSFASGMARFDTGAAPDAGERVLGAAVTILLFPLGRPVSAWFPLPAAYRGAPWEHFVFAANSLLWGAAIYALWRTVRRPSRAAFEPSGAGGKATGRAHMTDNRPDPRFRNLTPGILAGVPADEVGDAVVHHVAWCLAAAGEEARETVIRALPPGTQAIYTTYLVDLEVNNGGFNQFFFNRGDEFAGLALAGYELLGAEEYSAVMRAAIATRETERARMAPYYEANSLKAFSELCRHTALNEIDGRYYSLGDQITDVWARFVRSSPELFVA
jgi:hypothetical protein